MKHIVKRGGHVELYDSRKLYASVYACALSVREPVEAAELIAETVVKHVDEWLQPKHEVTSADIHRVAAVRLKDINQDAGYMYEHNRVLG